MPEPEPGPGDVKLRVLYNGICGSDLHEIYDGPITTRTTPHPLTGVKNPVILGHELSGEVVACGEGVLRLTQLQKPGGKRLPAREFLAGTSLAVGQRFTQP